MEHCPLINTLNEYVDFLASVPKRTAYIHDLLLKVIMFRMSLTRAFEIITNTAERRYDMMDSIRLSRLGLKRSDFAEELMIKALENCQVGAWYDKSTKEFGFAPTNKRLEDIQDGMRIYTDGLRQDCGKHPMGYLWSVSGISFE